MAVSFINWSTRIFGFFIYDRTGLFIKTVTLVIVACIVPGCVHLVNHLVQYASIALAGIIRAAGIDSSILNPFEARLASKIVVGAKAGVTGTCEVGTACVVRDTPIGRIAIFTAFIINPLIADIFEYSGIFAFASNIVATFSCLFHDSMLNRHLASGT